jgi:hypothetical protein
VSCNRGRGRQRPFQIQQRVRGVVGALAAGIAQSHSQFRCSRCPLSGPESGDEMAQTAPRSVVPSARVRRAAKQATCGPMKAESSAKARQQGALGIGKVLRFKT